jgi:uncharacterized damage-inducible protein DinB
MSRVHYLCLMSNYNEWMNAKLYSAAMTLTDAELSADRGAFFGSILKTLNHLAVADIIWLTRFSRHPAKFSALDALAAAPYPADMSAMLFPDIRGLWSHRQQLDQMIVRWAKSVQEADLDCSLHYAKNKDPSVGKNFFDLSVHFFNHQTHHRGQITTLLTQSGIDAGVTDLLALLADQKAGRADHPD